MGVYTSKYTGEQIDNLLDQVENGGGAGSSSSRVTLWEGSITTANTNVTLSQSMEDFDYLIVTAYYKDGSNVRYYPYSAFDVDDVKATYGQNIKFLGNSVIYSYDNKYANSAQIFYQFNSATSMGVYATNTTTGLTTFFVTKIEGIKIRNSESSTGGSNPTGTIISFMGLVAPNGYLICDGSELNIADYRELATHFETQFGTKNHFGGDGTTTFALPDLRNEFLRGYHGEASEQLSGEVGIHQDATVQPRVYINTDTNQVVGYGDTSHTVSNIDEVVTTTTKAHTKGTGGSVTAPEGSVASYTSRPTNVAVLYCIKY